MYYSLNTWIMIIAVCVAAFGIGYIAHWAIDEWNDR